MATYQIQIPKLNGSNYPNWSSDMKYVLMERNLWGIVNESEKRPKSEDAVLLQEFNTRSNVALSTIYLNIEQEYRRIIENLESPVEAWKTLRLHFYPDSKAYHMKLFTDLCECKIKDNEPVDLFGARLLRISNQISNLDPHFNELYVSFQLIRYLPAVFDTAVQSILRWSKEKFIFKDIMTELVAEETRLKLREADLNSSLKVEIQHVQKPRKQPIICLACNRPGHLSDVCRYRRSFRSPSRYRSQQRSLDDSPERNLKFDERQPRSSSRTVPEFSRRSRSKSIHFRQQSQYQRQFPQKNYANNTYFSDKCKNSKFANFLVEVNMSNLERDTEWVFDTAASHHCCKDRNLFVEYTPLKDEKMAVAMKDVTFPILGIGTIKVKFGQKFLYFKNVMHSEQLRRNLISGPRLDAEGVHYCGGNGSINAISDNQPLFKAILRNGTYRINFRAPRPNNRKVKFAEVSAVSKENNLMMWHRRCAHINPAIIVQTSINESARGLPMFKNNNLNCETCKISKFRRKSFKPLKEIRSQHPLELLYADVWGPYEHKGREGERYFLAIIDDYSRKTALYPIREKSEVFGIVRRHILRAERFLGRRVKNFRSDNGNEFVNRNFQNFFAEMGINHELTNIYTPEQNGVIERFNQTVADGARTLLKESQLDLSFWPDAMLHFVYTWNRLSHKNPEKTPFEMYGGIKPSIRHLKPFGTIAYVGVPRQRRAKLEAKAVKGIMIGYAFRTKGYRIWLPEECKVIETINVSFDENKSPAETENEGAVLGPYLNNTLLSSKMSNRNEDRNVEESEERPPDDYTTSSDQESDSEDSQGSDHDDDKQSLQRVNWIRKRIPRTKGNKIDIYYYEEGKNERLRSQNDIKRYCSKHNINFNPMLFNFKGKDLYEGIIADSDQPDSSLVESSS